MNLHDDEIFKNLKLEVTGAQLIEIAQIVVKQLERPETEAIPEKEIYLNTDEVCEMLRISPVTLWNYDNKGKTKPLKIGRIKRYLKSEIEEAIGR
jgi:predicted DNA-binding transcriptional regulator AlpA